MRRLRNTDGDCAVRTRSRAKSTDPTDTLAPANGWGAWQPFGFRERATVFGGRGRRARGLIVVFSLAKQFISPGDSFGVFRSRSLRVRIRVRSSKASNFRASPSDKGEDQPA
jgi:hypothetical protein